MRNANERIVITGFGCLSSVGADLASTLESVKNGKSGIDRISQWDATDWEFPYGAEIKDYDPKRMLTDRKLLKVLSRHDVIGLNSVSQALAHSQLLEYRDSLPDATFFNDRTGVYVGSPGIRFQQNYDFHSLMAQSQGDMKKFGTELFNYVSPMWLLKILPNNVLAYTGIQNGFKGPNHNVANHAVSGIQAMIECFYALKQGIMDRALVVGYDAGVEPEGQIYYGSLGALSRDGLRPFDASHNGTILAEGAATFVLETLSAAKERNATIYGEILAGATTNEADGVFSIREDADGLIRLFKQVLERACLSPNDIGMIAAHGNGTVSSDSSEALAIGEVFGNKQVPVTSYKWALGHSLAAAGVLESLLSLQALNEEQVPGIANLEQVARTCDMISVDAQPQSTRSPMALIISRGFASLNTALIISNYVPD
ncbi:MAG: beta-ketoacyl synthase [Gammaproteobacteria bacterium]